MTGSDGGSSTLRSFVAGTAGGVCLVLAGYPMDTIKVRLQTSALQSSAAVHGPVFAGPLDCVIRTVRNEGIRGLYKGVSSPLGGVPWMYTISFGSWGMAQKMLEEAPNAQLSLFRVSLAGAISGIATTVVTTPVELLKIRLQTQYESGAGTKYRGLWDCAVKTTREEGVRRGLFKGFGATLLRDIPGSASWYGFYEASRRAFVPPGGTVADISVAAQLFSGGIAGVGAWSLCLWADQIKSRIQHDHQGKYSGIIDCFKQTVAEGGFRTLYRGISPVLVRAFVADAACFFGYEVAAKFLKKYNI